MRTTILLLFISITLMTGCTSASDAPPAPEPPTPTVAPKPVKLMIALDGVHLDMPVEQFKPLFKVEKTSKKGDEFKIALDTDTKIDFALDSYMGKKARGASAIFYDGRLAYLAIKIMKPDLPFFTKALTKQYGKPKDVFVPKTTKIMYYTWNLKNGEMLKLDMIADDGPWLHYASASNSGKYKIRLTKILQAAAKKLLSKPAYTATFTCTIQNRKLDLVACLFQAGIKVRSGVHVKMYSPLELRTYRKIIPLKEHFEIQARNAASSPYMTLNISIHDRFEKVVYEDSVTPGDWINVKN